MSLPSGISRVDRLGAGVSFLCAIHCAILPFAATVLPLLGFSFLADARLERVILIVSIALATMSVCWGIRVHRQRRILIVFGAALSLMLIGRILAEGIFETLFVVPGGLLFVCGHWINQRLSHECRTCRHS